MDKSELIHNWINYEQLDYEIFLCFTFDIISNEVDSRYIITYFTDKDFPCIIPTYQYNSFLNYCNKLSDFTTEDGDTMSHDKMSVYWKFYLDGFIKGFTDFKNRLKEDISIFNNNSFIEEILKSRLTNLHKYSLGGWKEIDKKKIIERSNFYNVGLEVGEIYYAWSLIIKGNIIFKDLIQDLYKWNLPYLKHHHSENDFRPINEFPCHNNEILHVENSISIDNNIELEPNKSIVSFKDLIREEYLKDDQYNRFIKALQKKENSLSKSILNDNKKWNYSAVQILKIFQIFKENKILKTNTSLLLAKKQLSTTFGIKYESISKKTVKDVGITGESPELHRKLDFYVKKIFFNI